MMMMVVTTALLIFGIVVVWSLQCWMNIQTKQLAMACNDKIK